MLPNHAPPKAAHSAKREPLFTMSKSSSRLECSLLFHSEFGVEAQFFLDGDLHSARTFIMKALALGRAEQEHDFRKRDGWPDAAHKARHD
jgi:hypothetical protein